MAEPRRTSSPLDGHSFAVGEVFNLPLGDDHDPHAVVVRMLLPWQETPDALVIYTARDWPEPQLPSLTTADLARRFWRPWKAEHDA